MSVPVPPSHARRRHRGRWARALSLVLLGGALLGPASAQADVVHRATSCTHSEGSATVVVTKPAGTVADDVMIASAVVNDGGNIIPPAGWTAMETDQPNTASWYRVAGGSEGASYSFTSTSPDTFGVAISSFSGADTATPIADSAKSSGTGSSVALPTANGARNGSMRWSSIGTSPSNNVTFTWSGGMTESCERAGNDASLGTAHQVTGTGATAARTVTISSSEPYWAYTAVVNAALPQITSISPNQGPTAGGQSVTITGRYLTGATGVTFGGTAGTAVTVVNDTTITVTTPARAIGTYDVRVTTTPGTSLDAGAADNYTYLAPPTVTGLAPAEGPTAGGTSVTITGTNFIGLSGAAAVQFGGVNASSYSVVNATTITATAPAGTGTQDVRVTTPGGTSANTAADNYTYYPPPTVTVVSPDAGPTAGGTFVTITGTNFSGLSGASAVQFGGVNATSYTVFNATTITATAPAGSAGVADVRVTTPGGTSANTAADNYTYYNPPTVSSISP
ncbi:MAG: IPT/TIG domain-containing protein, partial [Solirubrobacteraceae bacterium]|nr:IPT/TIG domain-containing protein [Solirubrobacteraceae bacterium]